MFFKTSIFNSFFFRVFKDKIMNKRKVESSAPSGGRKRLRRSCQKMKKDKEDNSYPDVTKTFLTSFQDIMYNVLKKYNILLILLAEDIEESLGERKLVKFCEIQHDMFKFLKKYKNYFRIKTISLKGSEKILLNIDFSNYYSSAKLFFNKIFFYFFIEKE